MKTLLLLALAVPVAIGSGELMQCYHPAPLPTKLKPVVTKAPSQERCLAVMVYGEARGEPEAGQVAVAYTALNRAKKQSVCDVVLAPKQYSTFNGNALMRLAALSAKIEPRQRSKPDIAAWARAQRVAELVYRRKVADPTAGSTHYLAPVAMNTLGYTTPKWAQQYRLVKVIAGHQFYKYASPKKVDI